MINDACLAVELSCITIPKLLYGLAIMYEPAGRCFVSGLSLQSRCVLSVVKSGLDKVWTIVYQTLFRISVPFYAEYKLSLVTFMVIAACDINSENLCGFSFCPHMLQCHSKLLVF